MATPPSTDPSQHPMPTVILPRLRPTESGGQPSPAGDVEPGTPKVAEVKTGFTGWSPTSWRNGRS